MVIARLHDIRLQIGHTPILTGVDLTVESGERVGIAGPNGSGKTTLLSVLATLRTPTGGEGEVLGVALDDPEVVTIRPRIGLSGHEPALYDELTLRENVAHVARLTGASPSAADDLLSRVGLAAAADRRADRCSNGMRRRTDLARLLLTRPQLVLLDEAHAGLDADATVIVDAICERTTRDGGAVVMVSHDPETLAKRAGRVIDLVDGRNDA